MPRIEADLPFSEEPTIRFICLWKLYKDSSKKNENSQYMVKISGIWEDYEKIGLTYKFMEIYHVNKF